MKVQRKAMVAGVVATAGAMTVLGTGVAQALDPEMPNNDYQLCGNVRDSFGVGVGGVAITGELSSPSWTSPVVFTAADGGYCIQGTAVMVNAILNNGAWVTLEGEKASIPVNFGTWESSGIYLPDFLAQWAYPWQSAYGFDGVY